VCRRVITRAGARSDDKFRAVSPHGSKRAHLVTVSTVFPFALVLATGAGCAGTRATAPPAAVAAPAMPLIAAETVCPTCRRVFDGKAWDGWEHDPLNWTITPEGAMRGFGKGARSAFTKSDHGDFRLIVTSRMAPKNKDHLGLLFWGPRPEAGSLKQEKTLQVQPPHGAMWDYLENHDLPHEKLAPGSRDFETWHVTEVLAHITTGTIRVAVDGVEIGRYQDKDPARLQRGPIGMQKHGGGGSEYKDIFLEVDPGADRLLTVPGSTAWVPAPAAPTASAAPATPTTSATLASPAAPGTTSATQ
jgi:hypothetical protein